MNKKIYYQFFFFPVLLMILLSIILSAYDVNNYTHSVSNELLAIIYFLLLSTLIFYFLTLKIIKAIRLNEIKIKSLNDTITQQKQELELREMLLTQKSKNEALGKMMAVITHQWRQPLNTINSITAKIYKDMKVDELSPQRAILCINEIEDMTDFMSQTMTDFSNFYTPVSNKEYFNVKKSIEETFNIVFPKYCKNEKPEIEIESSEEIELLGLKSSFQQVFLTLINNSVENFEIKKIASPKINIQLSKEDYIIKVVYSDNGNGIEKSIIDKIFNPNITTKNDIPNRGLGLSIAKEVLKTSFNGTISVENSDDKSIFTILVKDAR